MTYACRLPQWEGPPRERAALAHAAAYCLLESALAAEYGLTPGKLAYARAPGGKPYLCGHPEIRFSVSHCRGLAACHIGPREAGVDAEGVRPMPRNVLRRAFTAREQEYVEGSANPDEAFFCVWTLKESFVKAEGSGLGYGLTRVPLDVVGGKLCCADPAYAFSQRVLWGEFVVSVCERTGDVAATSGEGAPN